VTQTWDLILNPIGLDHYHEMIFIHMWLPSCPGNSFFSKTSINNNTAIQFMPLNGLINRKDKAFKNTVPLPVLSIVKVSPNKSSTTISLPVVLYGYKEWLLTPKKSLNLKLSPWGRVLLVKMTIAQRTKKLSAFYGTRRFITIDTAAQHWHLHSACSIHTENILL